MAPTGRPKKWVPIVLVLAFVACVAGTAIALYVSQGADVAGEAPGDRTAAIRRIAARRPPGARKALARAVSDPSPKVRREAHAALTHFIDREDPADREVVEQGTRDADGSVRAVAADTLGLFRDGLAADVLVRLIQTDPDKRVRLAAVRGLAKCDDPRSIAFLLETAEEASSRDVRHEAMRFLMRQFGGNLRSSRDPRNVPAWKDMIQRWKRDQRVRQAYAAAGIKLVDRPQDILGKDFHPERHGEPTSRPAGSK